MATELPPSQYAALRVVLEALRSSDASIDAILSKQFLTKDDLDALAAAMAAPGTTTVAVTGTVSCADLFKATRLEDWANVETWQVGYLSMLMAVAQTDGGVDLSAPNVSAALRTLFPGVAQSPDLQRVTTRILSRTEEAFGAGILVRPEHCGRAYPEKAEPVKA